MGRSSRRSSGWPNCHGRHCRAAGSSRRTGCKHLFSTKHDGVEIQKYCAMIACMLILIYTGRRPDKAMLQMVRFYLDGWASIEELEAFITSRR